MARRSRSRATAVLPPPLPDDLLDLGPSPAANTTAPKADAPPPPPPPSQTRIINRRPVRHTTVKFAEKVDPTPPPKIENEEKQNNQQNQETTKPVNQKPKQEGKTYTPADVENLPSKLEKQISELHTSIAQTLIKNSSIMNESADSLRSIGNKISQFNETTTLKDMVEQKAYKKLNLITSDHKVSQSALSNKREVIKQFKVILEKMKINPEWVTTLTQTKFEIENLKKIQSTLQAATENLQDSKTPNELVGLTVAKERQQNISDLLKKFTVNFVNFFKDLLSDPTAIAAASKNMKKIENIPIEDVNQEPEKFSEDVSGHKTLNAIYSYSGIIIWIKKHDAYSYSQLVNYFHTASKVYSKEILVEIVENATEVIKSFKPPSKQMEFFGAGKYMKNDDAGKIWDCLEDASNRIFNIISREKVILKEYWKTSDKSLLDGIVLPDIYKKIEAMWEAAQNYDMFFLLRGMSLNYYVRNTKQIPLDPLIESFQSKWETYFNSQIDMIQAEKINPNKTHVMGPFKQFPSFIFNIMRKKKDYDQELIDDVFEKLVSTLEKWLVEVVGPKAEKKKKERLIVVNIHYIISKLLSPKLAISQNENMMAVIDQAKEFMSKHINLLLKELVRKTWKNPTVFFGQITKWMNDCGLTPEVVTFQPTHIDEKFQELVAEMSKSFMTNYKSCIETLQNKIKDEDLRGQIIQDLSPYLESKWSEWNDLAIACYGIGVSPTIPAVHTILFPEK